MVDSLKKEMNGENFYIEKANVSTISIRSEKKLKTRPCG
jgi:hypothetical protein